MSLVRNFLLISSLIIFAVVGQVSAFAEKSHFSPEEFLSNHAVVEKMIVKGKKDWKMLKYSPDFSDEKIKVKFPYPYRKTTCPPEIFEHVLFSGIDDQAYYTLMICPRFDMGKTILEELQELIDTELKYQSETSSWDISEKDGYVIGDIVGHSEGIYLEREYHRTVRIRFIVTDECIYSLRTVHETDEKAKHDYFVDSFKISKK